MLKRNVWNDVESPLEMHIDDRGKIADIFYNDNFNHVAIIESIANIVRGNHYHKQTTQHVLVTKGSLEYWYKNIDSDESAKSKILKVGDVMSTPPNEIHALKTLEENEFIVFSQGLRGGKDYEEDTYRVKSIIPN